MTPGCATIAEQMCFHLGMRLSFLLLLFTMLKLIKNPQTWLKIPNILHLASVRPSEEKHEHVLVQMICLVHFRSGCRRFSSIVLHLQTRVCYRVPLASSTGYSLQSDGMQVVLYHRKLTAWKIYESLTSYSTVPNTRTQPHAWMWAPTLETHIAWR